MNEGRRSGWRVLIKVEVKSNDAIRQERGRVVADNAPVGAQSFKKKCRHGTWAELTYDHQAFQS
jgi:hypothetical protein